MPAISKFLFDTPFDRDPARGSGKGVPAPSRKIVMTASEIEAAKAAAYAEGHAAGRTEAAAEGDRLLATAIENLTQRLTLFAEQAGRHHAECTRDAIAVSSALIRRILPTLIQREGPAEIEALVAECLSRAHDEPRIVVRVNDAILDTLRERIDGIAAASGFGGRIVLLADPALAPADARVEWADGGVDRQPARVETELESAIARYLNSTSADRSPSGQ